MSVDEALFCSFEQDTSRPILRTYAWDPPALSLGRFQNTHEVLDLEHCRRDNVAVVRRISGGGTIYHADELTYCIVCAPEQIPTTTSVKDTFRVLTGFLIDFYRSLGLNARYAVDIAKAGERLGERTAFCFAGKESYDILIDGRKIGGNAQRRRKNIIFQHGSIPVINRAYQGLQYMKDRSPGIVEHSVSLTDFGVTVDLAVLKSMLVDAFRRHMGVVLDEGGLSAEELSLSQALLREKYELERWNLQGDGL